ncbi:MAG: nucleotidyltransferase domain-containing protein [bacterium]
MLDVINAVDNSVFLSLSGQEQKKIVDAALKHQLGGVLYVKLRPENKSSLINRDVFYLLESYWRTTAAKNMVLFHQLKDILKKFRENKINSMVLKGAYFADKLYPSIGSRPMSDIDILIYPKDQKKADEILTKSGYYCRWNKTWIDKFHYHYGYFPPLKNQFFLEVHWLLAKPEPYFTQNIKNIFQRAEEYEIEGEKTKVMSPEDQVVYLSIHHAWSHGFSVNLIQLFDLVLIFEKLEIDLNKLVNISKQYHAEKAVYITLKVVNKLFKNSIDSNVIKKLNPENFPEYLSVAAVNIVLNRQQVLNTAFSRFMSRDKVYRKVFSLIKSVFPERKVLAEIYQLDSLSNVNLIHYMQRLKDLVVKYRTTGLNYVFRKKNTRNVFDNERIKNRLRNFLISNF